MGVLAWAVVTAVGGVVVAVPAIAPVVLPVLGFGAAGPMAGGLAAGAQAFVGNVAAGAIFGKLQALAMVAPIP